MNAEDAVARQQWIDDVRKFLVWLEENPVVPAPTHSSFNARLPKDATEREAVIRTIGTCKKEYLGNDYINLTKDFGSVKPWWFVNRGLVCRKVVKGTRRVEAKTVEVPAHDEEIFEWECDPLLAPQDQKEVVGA